MPTVIDALLVTLGLDESNFTKGVEAVSKGQKKISDQAAANTKSVEQQEKKLSDAQVKRAKELDARSKQIAQGISKIRNEALSLFAVFTGGVGLKNFIENTIKTAAGLDRMSANLDMSAKDLSMWQLANKNAGGTVEGMTEQLKEASAELAKLQTGGGSDKITNLFKWSAMAGVNLSINDLKSGTDVLMARSRVLQALSKIDISKARVAAEEMGISEDTFNLLKQGPEAVMKLRDAQKDLADTMAAESKEAEELRKKMDALGNSFNASAVKILSKFTPALQGALDTLKNVAGFLNDEEAMDQMSGRIARILAFFGNKEAKEALAANEKYAASLKNREAQAKTPTPAGQPKPTSVPQAAPAAASVPQVSRAAAPATNLPRGMRNNNPGNIEYGPFAKKYGATGSDGRFAIFPTLEKGIAAMHALLSGYLNSGTDTVRKAISKWAPSKENNTAAYIDAVSKRLGVSPDQKLGASHIPALANAISQHENGAAWGRNNALAAANMPAGAAATARAAAGQTVISTTDVKVGQINVQTQATDAPGIAKSIGPAVQQYGFVSQANTGLS